MGVNGGKPEKKIVTNYDKNISRLVTSSCVKPRIVREFDGISGVGVDIK